MIMKLGMEHYELEFYIFYINDDLELTLTYFTIIVKLGETCFCTYRRPTCQVSVYRTIGPLVYLSFGQDSIYSDCNNHGTHLRIKIPAHFV